jgi:hypothetical protein
MYVSLNPANVEEVPGSSPCLSGLGASGSALDTVASSLGTSSTNLLLMIGAGAVIGWAGNSLLQSGRKSVRKSRSAMRKRKQALADATTKSFSGLRDALPILIAGSLVGGAVYYFATRKAGAKS